MHADALQRPPRDEDLAGAVLMAVALHVGLAAFLLLASWWSPAPREISVAGPPVINRHERSASTIPASAQRREASNISRDQSAAGLGRGMRVLRWRAGREGTRRLRNRARGPEK